MLGLGLVAAVTHTKEILHICFVTNCGDNSYHLEEDVDM